jgi:hypothetical protein
VVRASMLVWVLLIGLVARSAHAGALDRFEDAHRPSDDGHKTEDRSRSQSSTSSSSSDDDDWDEEDDHGYDDEDDTGASGDSTWALFFFCALPPVLFACVHPAHRPAREPYGGPRLYLEPMGERSEDGIISERRYHPKDREKFRWAELSVHGFRAFNEPVVYSHDLDGTVWLGPILLHLSWEHFYEQIEQSDRWDHLNLYGVHLGANTVGPFVDGLELYLLAGASAIHGDAFTPAFDAGLELRAYPIEPLALYGSAMLSFFEIGPVLVDGRAEIGVALGPVELRAGPRWLYQGDAQGFWGPMAALAARF